MQTGVITVILLHINQKCSCLIDKTYQYNNTLIYEDQSNYGFDNQSNYGFDNQSNYGFDNQSNYYCGKIEYCNSSNCNQSCYYYGITYHNDNIENVEKYIEEYITKNGLMVLDICNIQNDVCLLRYDSKKCLMYYIIVPTISIFIGIILPLVLLKIVLCKRKKKKNILHMDLIEHYSDIQYMDENNNNYRRLSE